MRKSSAYVIVVPRSRNGIPCWGSDVLLQVVKHNPSRRIDMPLEIFNQRQHALRCIDADPSDPRGICNKASVSWQTTRARHARFTEEPNDSFIYDRFPEVAVTIFAESCETFVDAIARFSYCLCIKAAFHPDELWRGVGGIKVFQEKTRELESVGRTASSAGIERSFLNSQDGRRAKTSVKKRAGHGRLKVDQPVTKREGHAPKNMYAACSPRAIKPSSPTRISIAHMLHENAMIRSSAALNELAVVFHGDVHVSGRGESRSGLLSTLKRNMDIENEILLIIKIFLNIFPEALNYPDMPLMQLEADSLIFHEVADAFNFMCVHNLSVVDIFSHGTLMGLLKHTTTA